MTLCKRVPRVASAAVSARAPGTEVRLGIRLVPPPLPSTLAYPSKQSYSLRYVKLRSLGSFPRCVLLADH